MMITGDYRLDKRDFCLAKDNVLCVWHRDTNGSPRALLTVLRRHRLVYMAGLYPVWALNLKISGFVI